MILYQFFEVRKMPRIEFCNPKICKNREEFIELNSTKEVIYYKEEDIDIYGLLDEIKLPGVFIFFDEEDCKQDAQVKIGETLFKLSSFDYFNPLPLFFDNNFTFVKNEEEIKLTGNIMWLEIFNRFSFENGIYYSTIDKTINFHTEEIVDGKFSKDLLSYINHIEYLQDRRLAITFLLQTLNGEIIVEFPSTFI